MRRIFVIALCAIGGVIARSQNNYEIKIESKQPSGIIDEMLYGQLFEHIYFSANNGVWQELIQERSFEPEQYPGIRPRDGYFDGWFMDDDMVLHSPTRYEQPLKIDSIDTSDFDLTMDVNWRAYKLARRAWSGGLMDIRFAFRNKADGKAYYLRIHDPYYESRPFNPGQTQAQIEAAKEAEARTRLQQSTTADFSICTMEEREMPGFGGRTRRMNTLVPLISAPATKEQVNENQQWHKLRVESRGSKVTVFWDGKEVLSYDGLEKADRHFLTFWVNYTEATYRNIKLTTEDGKVLFEGTPGDVQIPAVAQQWTAFGEGGQYRLIKDDAVNMRYSQEITAGKGEAGIYQAPQNIIAGEKYVGSIYAKGKGELIVGLRNTDGEFVARQSLGKMGKWWKKYEFTLEPQVSTDGDFAIAVKGGTIQVDMATMTTQTGIGLGGFRPDILQAVKELHPTCLRWPGGGYVAQYDWKWGIGPQENRERWAHWMWMDYDQNCFGTDEFIRFCREVNSEPIIVVSVKFERPAEEYDSILQDAVNWLRYCNAPATDEWGAKRAANGHPEPYNVKYWEIDNEMWEMGIDRYEKCVRDFSTAMRKIDPTIKIIACGGFREDEDFIKRSGNFFDYLSLHHYEQQGGYATGPVRLAQQYDRYAQMIANGPNPNIKLFISEWNLNSIDWRTGLFAGGFLNMCEARDVVAMGAAALFIRRTDAPDWNNAFINFDYKDLFKAPNCQVTELWYDHFSKYRLAFSGDTGNLSVSTTMQENGAGVIVKVVNPTEEPATLRIKGDWAGVKDALFEYYAPGSLTVANSMENKHAVALQKATPQTDGCDVVLSVPALSAGVLTISTGQVKDPLPCGPVPTENQLCWQDMEMYAFIHYSLNTYTDQEWGFGNEDPKLFNPSDLDCRQWARVCKQAGMKGVIFTAKHHCGFCMWPSKYTEYSVKNSPWKDGKGDVVRELADACREEGLKFAVYLSPWDRNHPEYGRPEYVTYFRNQLRELLTEYGDIFEVWFDGANGGDGWYGGANETRKIDRTTYYQWPETYKMIRELQPNCLIWNDGSDRGDLRWVGTEAGNVGETNWSLLNHDGEVTWSMLHYGLETGDSWVPGETNTSIRPGWFYHDTENEHVKSLSKLMDTYYKSVGRNSTLLLNFPIAPNGRIHPTDSLRGIAFNKMIHEVFETDLAKNVKTINNSQYPTTIIDFGKPTAFNRFVVEEDIRYGQRVKKFALEAEIDGKWQPLKDALVDGSDGLTTIGHRRIICFPTIKATSLRLTIVDAKCEPMIKRTSVYLAPELTADIPDSGEKRSSGLHYFFSDPKQMMIDWETEQTITAFRYLPPQDTSDGLVTHYSLWASTDWTNWTKVAQGEFSNIVNNPIWLTIKFAPTKAKILRLDADRLAEGERMAFTDFEVVTQ